MIPACPVLTRGPIASPNIVILYLMYVVYFILFKRNKKFEKEKEFEIVNSVDCEIVK